MKYLFVDFDGVLHAQQGNRELFSHSPVFCERLFKYKENFRIIISSSWREEYEFDVLTYAFEVKHNSLMNIVIASTPILPEGFNDGGRYLEIKSYCLENNIPDSDWVAIDDMERLFPKNCPNLILTQGCIGLRSDDLDKIEEFLK